MGGFIEGEHCQQSTKPPERIDDYIEKHSVDRFIGLFTD
jgi:hypothetical protein